MVPALLLILGPNLSAYRTWICVTPQPIDMARRIAVLCAPPRSWDVSKENPHLKKRFKVWVNPIGKATMAKPLYREDGEPIAGRFPEGTVIVKEKFDASVRNDFARKARPLPVAPELLTVMVKGHRGSKPQTGDWSYFITDGFGKRRDGSSEARCAGCHAARPEFDFTFRNYR